VTDERCPCFVVTDVTVSHATTPVWPISGAPAGAGAGTATIIGEPFVYLSSRNSSDARGRVGVVVSVTWAIRTDVEVGAALLLAADEHAANTTARSIGAVPLSMVRAGQAIG
jgi:hypothetical protein